ncbi:hypothetical protein TSAR_009873 [Trichomalopsis sarcophagae]|uniref:Uncharacterized protein n=1 Tax=Trichomalopsis sarcophagae TaxID=543379 RepID=A0A232FJB7_9HYME|nr:hypothetical protein TSAR_009873 [Trichomalopsis sarcophagae]
MPRLVRDSDEDVETKSVVRRTRASSAASSITDSPRRATRSNKQLSVIESSPESLDDSNVQPTGRATRSRTATLDKTAPTVTKNLRSRKNSASSDLSESVVEVESEVTQKRLTRKNTSALPAVGTPTKANLRSRSIRAGSEAKSTPPPTRSKRVTRASSVDHISLNESTGTPVKRRTRASMVPMQPTVTEEQEAKNKAYKSLDNTVAEVDEDDSESVRISKKEKSTKKSKTAKEAEEDTSIVNESINNSKKSTTEPSNKMEDSLIDKSSASNNTVEESTIKSFAIHSLDNTIASSTLKTTFSETVILESSKHENLVKNLNNLSNVIDKVESFITESNIELLNTDSKFNDDECEIIDVENSTESTLTDELFVHVDNIEKDKNKVASDNFKVDIKDSYVKLNRTSMIEKILTERVDEIKSNAEDFELNSSNNVSQNSVITNAKTAIVLVNDFVKSNENLTVALSDTENNSSISNDLKDNLDVNNKNVSAPVDESQTDKLNLDNDKVNIHDHEKENSIYTNESESNSEIEVCLPSIVNVIDDNLEKSISSENPVSDDTNSISTIKNISIKESSVILNDLNNDNKYSTMIKNQSENCIGQENKKVDNCEIANTRDDKNDESMPVNKNNDEIDNLILVDEDNDEEADHFMDVDSSNNEFKNAPFVHANNDELKTSISTNQNNFIETSSATDTQYINNLRNSFSENKSTDGSEILILIDEDSNEVGNVESMDVSDNDVKSSFNFSIHHGESENSTVHEEIFANSRNNEYKNDELKNSIDEKIYKSEKSSTIALSNDNFDNLIIKTNAKEDDEIKDSISIKQINDVDEINSVFTVNKKENIADVKKFDDLVTLNENADYKETCIIIDESSNEIKSVVSENNENENPLATNPLDNFTENLILPDGEDDKLNETPVVKDEVENSVSSVNEIENITDQNIFDNVTGNSIPLNEITNQIDTPAIVDASINEIKDSENLPLSDVCDNAIENVIPSNNENDKNVEALVFVDVCNDETNNSDSTTTNSIEKLAAKNSFDNAAETSECFSEICSSIDACDPLDNSEDTNDTAKDSTTISVVNVEMNTPMSIDEGNCDTCPNQIPEITEPVSTDQISNEITDTNENTDNTSATTVETVEVEIDQNSVEPVPEKGANNVDNGATLEPMDIPLINSNRNDEIQNIETNFETNQIQPKLCEVDKNSLSSAVTDADGDNASSPEKADQTEDDSAKDSSPDKSTKEQKEDKEKRRSKSSLSESEDNVENFFQDVLAEEYSTEKSTNEMSKSGTLDGSEEQDKSANDSAEGKQTRKTRRSLNKSQELDNSNANDAASQGSNDSLSKKDRNKSLVDYDDSGSQDSSNKTVIENADVSDELSCKSPNKSRRSAGKSSELNTSSSKQKKDERISEKLADSVSEEKTPNKSRKSLDKSVKQNQSVSELKQNESAEESANENKSPNKSRKSLDKSVKLDESTSESKKNESTSEKLSTSLNSSKSSKRKSLADTSRKFEELVEDEPMEVDEYVEVDEPNEYDNVNEKSLNKSRKSLDNSRLNKSKNESVSEKLSTSLNDSKKNNLSRRSIVKEEVDEDIKNESPGKNRKSLEKDVSLQDENVSTTESLSSSLNDSKKSKRLSQKLQSPNQSSRKSLIKVESEEIFSDNGPEENQDAETSLNNSNKRLSKSSANGEADLSFKNKDKSLRETSLRKSLNKSTAVSNIAESSDTETEDKENIKKLNKSANKSLNASKKGLKSANSSVANSPTKASIMVNGEDHDASVSNKDIKMEKLIDPESDEDVNLQHIFELDSEATEESDDEVKEVDTEEASDDEDDQHKSIDSDIAKEYNLAGKDISKYSDDDVPGDDCLASEEEFSDPEDEGEDLADFVVPDEEVEEDGSEDEDGEATEEVGDSESAEEFVETNQIEVKKEKGIYLSNSNKDKSINDSKSLKNKSANLSKSRLLDIADAESDDDDDEEKEAENEVAGNKSLKDKSLKNKSMNNSKSVKEKSVNLSKSILSTSKSVLNNSKSIKNKSVIITEEQPTEESDSEDEQVNRSKKSIIKEEASSESDSESEKGEDSYRIITTNPINPDESKIKNKKLGHLIECSTPKPGITKKNTDSFVDKNNSLSILTNKSSASTRRKSGSLDNLTDTKLINSRLSVGSTKAHESSKIQNDVDIVDTPEAVLGNRQPWKLVPLNKTVHPAGDDTPLTKFLKKAKLNDSVPVLQSMKSGSLSDSEEPKKNDTSKSSKRKSLPSKSFVNFEEPVAEVVEAVDKKSKKRKLQDISHVASLDDESMINIIGKKKKRARIEDSIVVDEEVEEIKESEQVQEGKKKKKKKSKLAETEEQVEARSLEEPEIIEDEKVKKKKKNKLKVENKEEVPEVLESLESQDVKQKKKKKKSLDAAETQQATVAAETVKPKKKKSRLSDEKAQQVQEVAIEEVKPKKKKTRLSDEKSDQENRSGEVAKPRKKSKLSLDSESVEKNKKSKKKKKHTTTESDDEAPDDVGFDEAKRSALTAMQQAADGVQALKMARKKKYLEHAERMTKQEPVKKSSLKRLSEDVLEGLTDEPVIRQPNKRQKLSKNKERSCVMPSTSMFSPGKPVPVNLKVDEDYIALSDAGGTTQFGVVNLAKAKKPKITKTSIAAISFRERMLARNQRQPISAYHMYQMKQKAKSGL